MFKSLLYYLLMRKYELILILQPDLEEAEKKQELEKISKIASSLEGKVEKKEVWGKKTLAYQIKKFNEGIYIQLELNFPEEKISEFEKKIKLENKIIRYLLICRSVSV